MRIAIRKSSLRTFNGFLGTIQFKNGFSVDDVAKRDIQRLEYLCEVDSSDHLPEIQSVEVINGKVTIKATGGGIRFDWYKHNDLVAMTIENHFPITDDKEYYCIVKNPYGEVKCPITVKSVKEITPAPEETPEDNEPSFVYNREDLEKIADKEGICGLRHIGDKHGIKGRSIAELIDELTALKA